MVAEPENVMTVSVMRGWPMAVFACATFAAQAQAPAPPAARLVPAQSEIRFQVKQSGVPVEGRFARFDAQLTLDPKAPQTGSVTVSIDSASASVGFAESDAELPGAQWFNVARFPRAVFQSSAIRGLGDGRFQAAGKLALKGVTQDLVVPVAIVQAGGVATATGEFVVRRLDFRIGEGEWADVSLVANDVRVRFRLVFAGLGPM
jgi:polyisoprenoid-binding protein YceI